MLARLIAPIIMIVVVAIALAGPINDQIKSAMATCDSTYNSAYDMPSQTIQNSTQSTFAVKGEVARKTESSSSSQTSKMVKSPSTNSPACVSDSMRTISNLVPVFFVIAVTMAAIAVLYSGMRGSGIIGSAAISVVNLMVCLGVGITVLATLHRKI